MVYIGTCAISSPASDAVPSSTRPGCNWSNCSSLVQHTQHTESDSSCLALWILFLVQCEKNPSTGTSINDFLLENWNLHPLHVHTHTNKHTPRAFPLQRVDYMWGKRWDDTEHRTVQSTQRRAYLGSSAINRPSQPVGWTNAVQWEYISL